VDGKLQREELVRGTAGEFSYRMQLNGIAPGIYVIRVEGDERHYSQTIIKN